MQRRRPDRFTTIRTEGALLPSEMLARIAAGDPTLPGLNPEAYHLDRGEKVGEAINRSWNRLTGAWASFNGALAKLPAEDHATTVTRERWLLALFSELGYGRLQAARALEIDGKSYAVSHEWASTPIHLLGARVRLDRRTAGVVGASRSSPHALMQELVNHSEERLWGIVSNGLRLRILRDNVSLTRQAYVQFDLEAMMSGEVYADFVVLWLLAHQSRVEGDRPEDCWLERWSAEAGTQGARALEQLRAGVEAAIVALGRGFLAHRSNEALRLELRTGGLGTQEYYRHLLRLVYRLLFLFVAEDRGLLLHPGAEESSKDRYRRYYSLDRLRR
ncbi:MAG: Eco57I restriction-modification methylase domain-containing protein, partial [Acidimicrobiales bacterium]